jgi:hypothetical protein
MGLGHLHVSMTGGLKAAQSLQTKSIGAIGRRPVWGRSRLGPVIRLFDLPAPQQSLKDQFDGRQCGDEIDGRGDVPWRTDELMKLLRADD